MWTACWRISSPGEVFTYSYTDRNFYLNPAIQFSVQYNTGCGVIEEDGVYTYALYANLRQVLSGIYVVGAATALLALLCSNLHFYRRLKRIRQPLADAESTLPVYLAEGLPSPCLFGLFRPAIYLTPEAAEDRDRAPATIWLTRRPTTTTGTTSGACCDA